MSFIGGGKIVSIGNGGDGIRIGKGSHYNVAETYTAHNGGSEFVQEGSQEIPVDLIAPFLHELKIKNDAGEAAIMQASESSGVKQ